MSGFRSGAGGRGSLIDDAIEDRQALFGTTPARQLQVRAFLMVFLVVIGVILAALWRDASLRPPHRALAPVHPALLIVPVGHLPDGLLDGVPDAYREVYGLTLTIADPVELDPALGGATESPIAAEAIALAVRVAHRDPSVVIAVTADRIITSGADADGDIAQRFDAQLAVISSRPLVSMKTISQKTLFRKVLTRQLGFLVWSLAPTDDPYDLLYRTVRNEIDVERVSDHL